MSAAPGSRRVPNARGHRDNDFGARWATPCYIFYYPCPQLSDFAQQEIDQKNSFDDMRPFWRKLGDLGLLGITADSKVKVQSTER